MLFYSAWALKALYFKLQSPIYTKDFIQALFSMAKCFLSNIDTHSWSSECIGRNLGFSVTDMQTGEARYWITNLLIGRWPAPPLKPQPHQTLQQICNFCRFTKVNWQIITINTLIANLTPLNHRLCFIAILMLSWCKVTFEDSSSLSPVIDPVIIPVFKANISMKKLIAHSCSNYGCAKVSNQCLL